MTFQEGATEPTKELYGLRETQLRTAANRLREGRAPSKLIEELIQGGYTGNQETFEDAIYAIGLAVYENNLSAEQKANLTRFPLMKEVSALGAFLIHYGNSGPSFQTYEIAAKRIKLFQYLGK